MSSKLAALSKKASSYGEAMMDGGSIKKEYCINWKNTTPDADGFVKEKTTVNCDPALINSLLRTLQGEYEVVCLTDVRDEQRKQDRIARLERELKELRGEVDPNSTDAEDDSYPMMDEAMPYDSSNEPIQYNTYFVKPGEQKNFYGKEEIRRISRRSLVIDGITADTVVSKNENLKTTISQNGELVGAQG